MLMYALAEFERSIAGRPGYAGGDKMEDKKMRRAAEKMLEDCDSVSLASITEDGYPRICEMEKVLTDGLNRIYFVTLKTSNKTKHFRLNSKSSVAFCRGDNSVSLIGNVKIIDDETEKAKILPSEYIERLRKKDMTRYCILDFETMAAKIFIDGIFETLTFS